MIKSLSPYILETPFVSPLTDLVCTSYTLQVFVWNGYRETPPLNYSYQITKDNPTGSIGNDKVDIARIVADYIDFQPFDTILTELIDGNNQYWVKTQVLYTTSDVDDYVPQIETTTLMVKGYNYGMSGQNAQPPTNKIFLNGTEFKVNRNGFFVFPFLIEEATPVDTPFATISNVTAGCVTFAYNIPYSETAVTVQRSTDSGVTWSSSTGSPISPRCSFTTNTGDWFRLKSIGVDEYYSNVFIVL